MCWEFKNVFADCPADCSKWKMTEEHPAYGEVCPEFALTKQHCKNPTQVSVAEKAGKCPCHDPFGQFWHMQCGNSRSQGQASSMNLVSGEPLETPNSSDTQLHSRSDQNPHSAHQPATQAGRGGFYSRRQQSGIWNNQASNLMYPDSNGVPPLGTYDRSSLSPDPPDLVVVSSSADQQTHIPPASAGNTQGAFTNHWSTSNYPNHGHSSQENVRRFQRNPFYFE
ncbi:hypothetical protein BCIN_09g03530 [Botrytis cinerea B05.10]|uniref:Uncharacterized protein n=2 Tax=Botryotinia fuckeliana TaxID=40559 RepID=A0A384JSJ3_BOTFB|nr:hypothetical protein BCIN_09g03530 [Botrytis cinerea B05.10]ATZ53513.1 hypothetical protein BCIN_09g03530 [Botrytis cinerea B05.10]EMR80413.1 hypothetical protein BcDW1_10922 [Botrytis cinerea BcDW1]